MSQECICTEGRNCWRIVNAQRVAFLIDSSAYFAALAAAAEQARQSIFIIGWDVDSRVRLVPDGAGDQRSEDLATFLKALVTRRRGLNVYVLEWRFAVIYTFEREALSTRERRWQTHRRVHFCLDRSHPAGASHHQKVVVVDDAIAFVGGIDVTTRRWDTPEHRADDPRRVDADGQPYAPMHDVQVAVDGEAAAALGQLARERWWRATGRQVRPSRTVRHDPWPPGLQPDVENVPVTIARTAPAYNGNPEVREVEALYLDAIAAARYSIYVEAQFFTSATVGAALASRLREADGPEVVLVLPRKASGWLEQTTMDVLRARLLRRLRAADEFGHLRVYCPVVPGLDGACVNVHSKVLVVDDRLVRVGSSNIANRSMGLDTECDVALEANGEARIEHAVAHFRNRLVGEHLGVSAQQVAAMLTAKQSLIETVDGLRGEERTLEPLDTEVPTWRDQLIPDGKILDPERPVVPEPLLEQSPAKEGQPAARRGLWLRSSIFSLVLIGLVMGWQWIPGGRALDVDTLAEWATAIQQHPFAPLLVIGGYAIGGLILIPVTVLIAATALAFGPLLGFTYSLLGCLVSALLTYGLGYFLGHETIRTLAGAKVDRLSHRIADHGLIAILVVRVVPVAPFTVVNLFAGASRIRLRDFLLGTCLGMFPGLLLMTVFGYQLQDVIRDPQPETLVVLIGLIVFIVLPTVWLRRRFLNGPSLPPRESPIDE